MGFLETRAPTQVGKPERGEDIDDEHTAEEQGAPQNHATTTVVGRDGITGWQVGFFHQFKTK
jgi:hypothetical protein